MGVAGTPVRATRSTMGLQWVSHGVSMRLLRGARGLA